MTSMARPILTNSMPGAAERDKRAESSISVTKVAPGVVGVADLDIAGSWRPAPVYGNVWFPTAVAADWAPYRSRPLGFRRAMGMDLD